MKLDNTAPTTLPDKIEVKKKQEKEITLLNSERKIKGLRLYEYDKKTGLIVSAEYQQNETFVIGQDAESKVHIKPGCIYVQAMNKENALKKVRKILK